MGGTGGAAAWAPRITGSARATDSTTADVRRARMMAPLRTRCCRRCAFAPGAGAAAGGGELGAVGLDDPLDVADRGAVLRREDIDRHRVTGHQRAARPAALEHH